MNKHPWFGLLLGLFSAAVLAAPLHDVAREGRLSQVKKLVEAGADVNAADYYGFTPLLLAKLNDHNITAGWLESKGAKTDLQELTTTIQLYLQYLGFPVSEADGLLGSETREAIRAFQRQQGLSVNGRVREAWVKQLHNKTQEKIQKQLQSLGLYTDSIDGLMGPAMRSALRTYQNQNGLAVNGSISKELLAKLQSSDGPASTDPASTGPASTGTESDPVAASSEKPSTATENSSDSATTPGGAISAAATTPAVDRDTASPQLIRYLQIRLQTLGYDPGDIDGEMGPGTEKAIRAFQKQSNLPVTGKISQNWIARLNLEVLRKLGYGAAVDITKPKLPDSENALMTEQSPEAAKTDAEAPETVTTTSETTKSVNTKAAETADPGKDTLSLAQLFRWESDLSNLSSRFTTRLQTRLKTLEFDPGDIDGELGPGTRSAISEFQKKAGLSVTGRISESWLPTLETELVKLTQAKLTRLDFEPGPVDGEIGSRTTNAIRKFQSQQNLTADGQTSDFLIAKINEAIDAREALEKSRAAEAAAAAIAKEKADSSSAQTIRAVQTSLQALGFYKQEIDGKTGSGTRRAIQQFQRQVKLKADGELDQQLVDRLNSEITRTVQARLQILGYQPGAIDGNMGTRTRDAIRSFERDNKYSVRGEATAALANRLQQKINSRLTTQTAKAEPPKPAVETKPAIETTKPEAAPVLVKTEEKAPAEKVELAAKTVAKLQTNLSLLGYDPGPADGKMGKRTTNAVRQYQSKSGLSATGEPTQPMLAKLNEEAAKAAKEQRNTKRSRGGNTEVHGKLQFQRASNGSLLGCSIKGVQLDRVWCDPFVARRDTNDCKVVLRPNSDVLLVKCS